MYDLRALLGRIQLLADLLKGHNAAQLAPDWVQYITLIREASTTGFKLLEDVLLGALDAASPRMYRTDLGALLTQRLVTHQKSLSLALDLPPHAVYAPT